MQLTDILSVSRIVCDGQASSKKRVFEQFSDLIARDQTSLDRTAIFDSLLSREQLGSTGLGHGIAIPHGRAGTGERALGALIKLREGIDYEAVDRQPVDLLFALLVPERSTEEHLQLLALLAEMFSNAEVVKRLRAAPTAAALYDVILDWQTDR